MMRMIASKPYVLRTLIHGVSGKFVPHLFVVSTPFWSTGKDRQLWWLGQDVKNFTQDQHRHRHQHQHRQLETQELPVQEEDRPPMPSPTSSPSASASLNLLSHSCFHFPRWLFWARSWSEASEGCRLSFILRRRSKRWIGALHFTVTWWHLLLRGTGNSLYRIAILVLSVGAFTALWRKQLKVRPSKFSDGPTTRAPLSMMTWVGDDENEGDEQRRPWPLTAVFWKGRKSFLINNSPPFACCTIQNAKKDCTLVLNLEFGKCILEGWWWSW